MTKKSLLKQCTPPIVWNAVASVKTAVRTTARKARERDDSSRARDGSTQALDIYWDAAMGEALETWGEGTAWTEIRFLMANCHGKALDIACGTGKTMEILAPFNDLEIHGCDISDFLINKAIERGIPRERLKVCDATVTGYEDDFFDYSYSIGSMEHFTEEGVLALITEARRITKFSSMHHLPVARNGKDNGWITPWQSYHNNSVDWWLARFHSVYTRVHVIDSKWEDNLSVGKWFICMKDSAPALKD